MPEGLTARASAARRRVQQSFAVIVPYIRRQIYTNWAANRKNLAAKQRLTQAGRQAYTDGTSCLHRYRMHPQDARHHQDFGRGTRRSARGSDPIGGVGVVE